ncbi:MAG: hypothetical protein KJ956_03385 [Actinobacteria bacterium]|nr:hypothetical protein [Actinomycetota bacterium]
MFGTGTILDVNPGAPEGEYHDLELLGHQVIICQGPDETRRCPLVENGACAMVDAADGVVFRLDLDDPYHRRMLRCYREQLGRTAPMHVVVAAGQERTHADLLEGLPVSVGEIGSGLGRFSSQVTMAAAARLVLSELATPGRPPGRLPVGDH